MDRMSMRCPQYGFTLIELMVVMVLLALLLGLGVPSMQRLQQRNHLRAEAHRLLAAVNLTRSEAVMRNLPVSLCPSAMAVTGQPVCSGHYSDGWIVFANSDRDAQVDPGTDQVLQVFSPMPAGFTLTNRSGSRQLSELISYLPDGSSRRNRTLLICAPAELALAPLGIVLNIVGRPRLAQEWGVCAGA